MFVLKPYLTIRMNKLHSFCVLGRLKFLFVNTVNLTSSNFTATLYNSFMQDENWLLMVVHPYRVIMHLSSLSCYVVSVVPMGSKVVL